MRTVIAHGHIFKNAGTSFDWALKRAFGEGFCDHRDDQPMLEQGASYLTRYLLDNPHIRAISTHHLCDTSAVEGIEVIPIYILRHPIERILSVYNFERIQDSVSPGSKAAKSYNFRDYVEWRMDPKVNGVIRNYQTVYMAGNRVQKESSECTLETFNEALTKLQSSLVGLVERFDASMIKFEESFSRLNIELDLSYIKKNTSREKPKDNVVSYIAEELGDIFKEVLNRNSYDMAIYCAATELFEKEHVKEYSVKLADFKRRCDQLT